jgi:predicted Fe-S protein YdhL (DUF1289 family)
MGFLIQKILNGNILRSSNIGAKRPTDSLTMSDAVSSPCIGICRLNAAQVCVGCGRSIAEIAEWLAASDARRAAIRIEASARLKSLQPTLIPTPLVPHE